MQDTVQALEQALAGVGKKVEDIDLVFLTHQHHDHAGLAAMLQERAGAQIIATAQLATYLRDFEASMDIEDDWAVSTMIRHGVDGEVAESLRQIARAVRRFGAPVDVDRVVEHGDLITVNGRRLRVLERPGHTPTDTVLHDEHDGLLFAGDHLLERISSNALALPPIGTRDSVGESRHPAEPQSLLRYLDSLRATAALDVSVVLPGHGKEFGGHQAVVAQREKMHARRADTILQQLQGPRTAAELIGSLWSNLPLTDIFLGLSEVLGHLQILRSQGRVRLLEDKPLVRWEPIHDVTTNP
jgi:glyoxylase-like metal-dependent hydrolase (beta-lactamase superfamily II)